MLAKVLKQRRDAERRLEQTSPVPVFNGGAADSVEGGGNENLDGYLPKSGGSMTGDLKFPDSKGTQYGSGVDMEVIYDGTQGVVDTSLIAASDLLVKCGTDKTMQLNEPVWEDLRVPLNSAKVAGTKQPGWESWINGLYLYWFDSGTLEELWFAVQMPHAWAGTSVTPHVHWTPKTTADGDPASQKVEWGLEYTWADIGADFPATQTVYGSTSIPNDTDIVANRHYMTNLTDITPSATQDGLSSMLVCRLFRNAADTDDTYEADAGLFEFDLHYEVNTLGSRTVSTK